MEENMIPTEDLPEEEKTTALPEEETVQEEVTENAADTPTEESAPVTEAEEIPAPTEEPENESAEEFEDMPVQEFIPAEPKKQRNGTWMAIAIMGICLSLVLGAYAIWAARNAAGAFNAPGANIPQSVTPSYNYRTEVSEGDKLTSQEIIKKLSPSVVTINVQVVSQGQVAAGFGSGVIYTDNGYILTNAHVVETAVAITVTDYKGETFPATLIGADSDTDTAVIKIEATGLIPAEFGQSSKMVPGDKVIAMGTPYAKMLAQTATQGIVSALRDGINFANLGCTLDVIQHDAAINSGNSGGPLVNEYGQVIGINTIKISGAYDNLGFALQIDEVIPIAEELMTHGKIVRPGIGITGASYDSGTVKGIYIYSVVSGGPADKAGLRQGDVILKADGTDTTSFDALKEIINAHQVGDTITVTYLRAGTVYTAEMVLEELITE